MSLVAGTSSHRRSLFGPLVVEFDDRVLAPRDWTLMQSRWAAGLSALVPAGPILELCAGAGQIGLAAAVLSRRDLVQVEADPVAAGYAVRNAISAGWRERTEVRVAGVTEAMRDGESFPIVLADPPYLPSDQVGRWPGDPRNAIDGGPDGLELVRACLGVASRHLLDDGVVLLQTAGRAQNGAIADELNAHPELALTIREVHEHDEERSVLLLAHP